MTMRSLLVVTMVLLISCSKCGAADAPRPPAAPAPDRPLFERLVEEAGRRDQADPSTKQVLAALQAAGLPIESERQHLGQAIGARHCVMMNTLHHVTLSVCEFADERSAAAGAQASREALSQIAGRTVRVKRSTVLSVIDSQADDTSRATARKVLEAFDTL